MFVIALLLACGTPEPAPEAPSAVEVPAAPEPAPAAPAATPEGPRVFFASPEDGAKVASPVKVVFGLEGMEVKPAGELAPNTGHHHLIVDGGPVPAGEAVPADARHIHFGKGQTETELELAPGSHTLTMQFADGGHISYGPDMSRTITVVVE